MFHKQFLLLCLFKYWKLSSDYLKIHLSFKKIYCEFLKKVSLKSQFCWSRPKFLLFNSVTVLCFWRTSNLTIILHSSIKNFWIDFIVENNFFLRLLFISFKENLDIELSCHNTTPLTLTFFMNNFINCLYLFIRFLNCVFYTFRGLKKYN